jgi:hypothetical protein
VVDRDPARVHYRGLASCETVWNDARGERLLRCLVIRGHEGAHQAYFGDRLFEWDSPGGDR